MRKLFFRALVGGFGGFVVGKLGASLVTTTLGFFLPGWSLAAFGAGRFICAANLLLYGLPYLAASEFGGLVKLGNKFSFPAAISMSLATAFGLPFAINSSIHASVAKIRSADVHHDLPALQNVHSVSLPSGGCSLTCADLLFSRRFDHITDIFADGDERTTPTLPPAIFRGTEDSVAFGTACDNADSSLKRIADQSHFRRDGDCIVSRKVSKPGDDVIVLVTEHRFAPGENGLFDVRHLYVGVQKGTRLSPAYEWSLTTDVSYFKAPLMFLIMASSDGLEFPTILESSPQNLAGDTELRAYVQNLQFLRP